jgi:hypothetical protein
VIIFDNIIDTIEKIFVDKLKFSSIIIVFMIVLFILFVLLVSNHIVFIKSINNLVFDSI